MKKAKIFLGILISIALIIALGITNIVPHFAVIPDMVKVGVDYISLKKDRNAVTEAEIINILEEKENTAHPFVLADKSDFEAVIKQKKKKAHKPTTQRVFMNRLFRMPMHCLTETFIPCLNMPSMKKTAFCRFHARLSTE